MKAKIEVDLNDPTNVIVDGATIPLDNIILAHQNVTAQAIDANTIAQERNDWRDELAAQIDDAKTKGALTVAQKQQADAEAAAKANETTTQP